MKSNEKSWTNTTACCIQTGATAHTPPHQLQCSAGPSLEWGEKKKVHHHHWKSSDSSVSSITSYTKTKKKKAPHRVGKNSGPDAQDNMRPGGTPHILAACKPLGWLNWSTGTLKPQNAKPVSSCSPASHSLSHVVPSLSVLTHTEVNQGSKQT